MFVNELFAAYIKYANMKGFKSELIHSSDGHIIAKITGNGVWDAFKNESGGHCCQRVPETESKGRKQKSMISVGILPIKEDVWEPIKEEEYEVTTQCGHGPGGQHQNKTESAVRVKHKETGITVLINGRDQHSNKRDAIRIMTARVQDKRKAAADKEYSEFRRKILGDGSRGQKVRTYNFMESRVTDHRTNKKVTNIKAIMKGELDLLK
jgi:peptide chain release factor 1